MLCCLVLSGLKAAAAMADTMSSLPLQQLIATINTRQLPVVLQVCSGIYFQGWHLYLLQLFCLSRLDR